MFVCLSWVWNSLGDYCRQQILKWTKPASGSLIGGAVGDVARTRPELIAENALLRQQLIVLTRQVKRPKLNPRDRFWLVVLASKVPSWQQALVIVQPATILRWHRELFRIIWRCKSKLKRPQPRIAIATILLTQRTARANHPSRADRIRGEPLKPGLRASPRTVQKYT
ncbi:MAG: integrase, partial [Shimia sp.]|nr:integrase [Shimia sp.]